MKITVAIRTFNRPGFLLEALSSIQFQSYTNWEVIIFDDGAQPDTFKVYSGFKNKNPNKDVMYITCKKNYYFYKESWMLAPKIANGEIIVRLDDDDILANDALEFIANTYKEHPEIDYTFGSCYKFDVNNIFGKVTCQSPLEVTRTTEAWVPYTIDNNHPWREPWTFKKNYYKTPQSYTSIIHCSKNAILCSYALYTMRVTSVLSILDKIKPSQHTGADDLEMMGTYEYLGLTYAPIKKTLIYVRTEHNNRQTTNRSEFKKTLSKVKDYVEYYRPNNFKTNPYKFSGIIKDNLDYKNYNELNNEFKTYHSLIKKNINKYL